VDFLSVLIEIFFARCYTAEAVRANIGSKSAISLQRGPVDTKFQVEVVAPPTTRLSDFSYGIKSGHIVLSFCHKSRV